jgi:DegV family protein with EDD domain
MLALITDSTCDLPAEELEQLGVRRVPLYVNFKGGVYRDWLEITPKDIVEGVQAGAPIPSTSQPSPQDFTDAYDAAKAEGADEILCITISSGLSGTYASATLAAERPDIKVHVFDSRAASLGIAMMVKRAAALRDEGAGLETILAELERIRSQALVRFTVGTLDFLKKNGRIGGARALLGSLLNVKPILSVADGKVVPAGRARGAKKATKMMLDDLEALQKQGTPLVYFLHIQDPGAAQALREELQARGTPFQDGGTYEIGAVIATHVGPSTYGFYAYPAS